MPTIIIVYYLLIMFGPFDEMQARIGPMLTAAECDNAAANVTKLLGKQFKGVCEQKLMEIVDHAPFPPPPAPK